MCADSDRQSYKGQCSEAHGQLRGITSTRPRRTEAAVLLLTVVLHKHRKWSALVIDIFEASILNNFVLATFHQTIADGCLNSFDHFWVCYNKPSIIQKCVKVQFAQR